VPYITLPFIFSAYGLAQSFVTGSVISLFLATIYISIPYTIPSEICAGFGIGQAIIIIYFDFGRADFMHAGTATN
jgi:hypothetical protein